MATETIVTKSVVDTLYLRIKDALIGKGEIGADTIVGMLPQLMDMAKQYPELKGQLKREIVLDVIYRIVNEQEFPISSETRLSLNLMLKSEVVGKVIDQLWQAGKGILFKAIGPDGDNVKACWKKCFPFCYKK